MIDPLTQPGNYLYPMLTTRGIVLKVVKYGETSIICDIYTEEVGLQSYIINGVRKKNAKYPASLFQPMYLVEIEAYDNPRKELNRIKEIKAEVPYSSIPFDIKKSSIGTFALEILRKSIRERETHQTLFDFIHSFFLYLDGAETDYLNSHLWFTIHLTGFTGFLPSGECNAKTPYFDIEKGEFVSFRSTHLQLEDWASADIFAFINLELENNSQVQLNSKTRNRLIEHLIKYYQYHIDGMQQINSHQVLAQVFG